MVFLKPFLDRERRVKANRFNNERGKGEWFDVEACSEPLGQDQQVGEVGGGVLGVTVYFS
jgi:hypothetical protein